ncbi:hypothetical protein HHK36_012287 [Tetracentron sinense]|uniref:CG-1 domain-containing protein n=1 Tax=Tetracentron sinense TaxID=13715 RepID=A0A835DFE0_TETSI|nr:hypothetical protein HHK36_012287 [Tetracentron sinense]
MERIVPGRLAGSEIHGFHTMEVMVARSLESKHHCSGSAKHPSSVILSVVCNIDSYLLHHLERYPNLDVGKIMEEATTRWLRPNEIHAILCNHTCFSIKVKPVNLPQSGTIILFDRKMLRNFRKDGHNWKKKKDGKTVKEAHEHLKVGIEERIHVYYAHGQDNPNFVRRCYWLLDKTQEHIVLVHYRETVELQGSPVTPVNSYSGPSYSELTPVNSNSGSSCSDPSASRILSEETDSVANHAFYAGCESSLIGESAKLDDNITVINHEKRLHEINTLEWEDLLTIHDPIDSNAPKIGDPKSNGNFFPTNNLPGEIASFGHPTKPVAKSDDAKLPANVYFNKKGDQINSNVQRKDFEIVSEGMEDSLDIFVNDSLQTQDSFGRWMNYIMTDSPGSVDDPPLESPIPTSHDSSVSAMMYHHQSSIQENIFSITDVSPAWAFSTEKTKVIVIGFFSEEHLHLAESNFVCVFGDVCVPVERVQIGVFRCMALPCNPGLVNLYLSFDGRTPISQVLTFEYRSPLMDNPMTSLEYRSKLEEFQVQMRIVHLLFSKSKSLNILTSKVSPNALKEAKKFADKTSSIDNGWVNLMNTIGNCEISFPQAKDRLFELILKNKLQEWLLERVVEGSKITDRDHQGQGIIHLCAILGYTWAVKLFSYSGLSIDFRDANGWTALHWAAYYGREQMVAVLLSAGARPNLVTNPTSENPGGCIAADLASKNGYDGLGAYLAEKGLIAHFNDMTLAGNASGSLQTSSTELVNTSNLNEEELCLKDTLTAYRTAADAASHIQAAFRERSLKLQANAVHSANPEIEARNIIAAMKIQHAFRNYETRKRMSAAARIQYRFRTWKIRREFLNMRRQAIRIQAVFRGFQVRRQYCKILWSVGILEKAILRWRQKRKGFRGLQVEQTEVVNVDQTQENSVEDFFEVSRKQAEERVERSVVRVQAMFRSKQAQQEYQRMKLAFEEATVAGLRRILMSDPIGEGTSYAQGLQLSIF